ncbi:MAG: hypothetical protein GY940_10725, partial [bacterium]|nr:hypothetical protein [bacterium]
LDLNLDDSTLLKRLHVPLDQDDKIKLFMGYEGNLQDMGTFVVNAVTLKGGAGSADAFSVNAKAIDTAGNIFDLKDKVWEPEQSTIPLPLATIVNKIASQNSLICFIDPTLMSVMTDREIQLKESDISFLRKLAEKYSAAVKFYDGKLLFLSKDSKSITGIPIPPVILSPTDIMDWSVTFGNRWSYKTFKAYWWDSKEAERKEETVTNSTATNSKEHIAKHTYDSQAEAKRVAQSNKKSMEVRSNNLTLSVVGNPALRPFTPVVTAAVRLHVDGLWRVGNATHTLNSSGYTTSLPEMSQLF